MQPDYFVTADVFYVFGAVMLAGVVIIAATYRIKDKLKLKRKL